MNGWLRFIEKSKNRIALLGIQREIEAHFTELGGRVYELLGQKQGIREDAEVQQLYEKLISLEKKFKEKR
jgi:hypothetical protein